MVQSAVSEKVEEGNKAMLSHSLHRKPCPAYFLPHATNGSAFQRATHPPPVTAAFFCERRREAALLVMCLPRPTLQMGKLRHEAASCLNDK